VRESGRPTDEVYKSFKSFTSLENQSRSQRGEQALCTPAAREKAFRKLLRLSRDEEERKWEIDEGVWDEATEEGQLSGEFGWYVGLDDQKFDDALETQEEENLGGGEGGGGGMAEGGGVGLGMGWETDLVEVEEERMEREMEIGNGVGRADKGQDMMLGERLVDGVMSDNNRREGKWHLRKDSKEVYSGMHEDGRWRRYSDRRDMVGGVDESVEYRENTSGVE
jgi:hypothetical protein